MRDAGPARATVGSPEFGSAFQPMVTRRVLAKLAARWNRGRRRRRARDGYRTFVAPHDGTRTACGYDPAWIAARTDIRTTNNLISAGTAY
jgi:hypothetical protein